LSIISFVTFFAISVALLVTFSTIGVIPILSAPFFTPSKKYSSLDPVLLEKYTGTFKMLVSGDTIRAQKKHGQPFDFRNVAKLIFSANEIPESNDQTYGYFKRWMILLFDKIFLGEDKDTR
jgi:hypothetical protein